MTLKDWIKLLTGYALAALMAGVIIRAMLALYQPRFAAIKDTSEVGTSVALTSELIDGLWNGLPTIGT